MNLIKGKKILLVGLGRLGGGAATANFLVKNGAKLTVTDLNSQKELKNSLAKLKGFKIKYVLEGHKEEDFRNNDIIIFNQAVGVNNKWVQFAKKSKKQIETDLTLMLKILEKDRPQMDYIAITGTRGKTTTTIWVHHFLKPSYIGGNIPELAPLKVLEKILKGKNNPLVLEIPSYQFEYWELNKKINLHAKREGAPKPRDFNAARSGVGIKAPKVALITNLYVDHLNRHGTMESYAKAKAQIFANQKKSDFLILNNDIDNNLILKKRPKSQIFYISVKNLPSDKNGLYFKGEKIFFQKENKREFIIEVKGFSNHQKYNLLLALLVCYLWGVSWNKLTGKIGSLPQVRYRQQVVLKAPKLTIINDSAATSPEATIAAIERFREAVFIMGGTDKQLDFKNLAKKIKKDIVERNLFLLNGSGTQKLIGELAKLNYRFENNFFENLKDIIMAIKKRGSVKLIVFSPGAASFEKFKNEFDRGQKFDKLIKETFKN